MKMNEYAFIGLNTSYYSMERFWAFRAPWELGFAPLCTVLAQWLPARGIKLMACHFQPKTKKQMYEKKN